MFIRIKLIIMFLAIASIPLVFVSILTFHNYKNSLEANHLSQLQNLTAFKAERIETYFAGLKADIKIAQGFYNIKKNLPVLTRLANEPKNPEFLAAKKMLDEQLQQMQSVTDMSDIMLVSLEGRVVYSSNPGHYPKDFLNPLPDLGQKAFEKGKNKVYSSDVFLNKQDSNKPEIVITAPATDFNGASIGVIAFEADMTPVYKLIQDATGLGKTGEVVVGKKSGNEVVYLNPLRHEPNTVMKKINIGEEAGGPIQEAVQGRSGAGQLIDYRGKKVIAAWRYIPSLDWGMVAKIDTKEAFADVTNLRNLIAVILVMIIVLSGVMAFSIAHSISEPIKRLSEGAEIIGRGNLDYKIGTNSKDEIGQLSRSFDKMTLDLKQTTASRDELSIEVRERKEAEEKLRQQAQILDQVHDAVITTDLDGSVTGWNKGAEKMFGFTAEEATGKHISFLHPSEGRDFLEKEMIEPLKKKEFYELETRPVKKSGEGIYIHLSLSILKNKDGVPVGMIGYATDISERKKAEDAIRRSREDLNRAQAVAHSGSWRLNVQRNELTWSEESYRIFGIQAGTPMTYEAFLDCVHPEDRKTVNMKWKEALRGKGYDIEHRIVADGQIKWVRERAELELDKDGTLLGGFGTVTDITKRKEMEEALREAKYGLENKVKERTAELADTVSVLQEEAQERIKAQEQLRSTSLYARGLLEASLDPLVTISPEGKITDVNKATELVTGVARKQLIGTDFSNYFTEPKKAKEGYQRVFAESFVTDYPLTIRHSDGRLTDVLYNASIYKDTHGNVAGVFAAARDVTERKRVESRQNTIKSLLELFAKETSRKGYFDSAVKAVRDWSRCEFAGIRIRDNDGNIPYESYVGFDNDFLALENALHLGRDKCLCIRTILENPQKQERQFVTDGGSFYCNDSDAFLKGLTKVEQKEYRGNCMKWGFKSISVIPIRYRDKVVGAIHLADFQKDKVILSKVQFIETTIAPLIGEAVQRFNVEAELEEYRQHLEDEVKLRTEELARSNRDLEQFAYVASHDLQEPLRAVAGFVGLLRMQLRDSLDAKKLEYMNFATDGVVRMQSLISGLLEYSRVGTRDKKPEMTDSKAALGRAIAHLGGGVREFGAKITIADDMPKVCVDSMQLAQVFQNLVGNAIKFCDKEAPQVHISAVREDNMWRFAVADNGIGIEPQYAERIFQIFQRLHSRDKYPGTGIGLSICKKIVERHGGKIWVESKPGSGSTFYFTIPDKGDIE